MRTTSTSRRLTLAVLIGAAGLGAATAPGVSLAQPIGGSQPAPKDCNLLGTRIRHGERGRRQGVEYECKNGDACQVEGGRTTTRCSHASRVRIVVRGTGGVRLGTAVARS